jgi:hypothetical protein
MTYIVQRDSYRCGPVAILNALRWAGADVTYKGMIGRLTQMCECKLPKGTKYRPFTKTLRKLGKEWFDIKLVVEPTLGVIEDALRAKKAMIWNFKHERGRHYAMIVAMSETAKTFSVANYWRDVAPLFTITREMLIRDMGHHDRLQRIWVLTKHD